MAMIGKVRRLHYRQQKSVREIARLTGLSRDTIRKWLKSPEGIEPKYRRTAGDTKIAPYAERLIKMLETDARRPVRDRRTALKLHAELKILGFDGNYSRVTEFIRNWRGSGGTAVTKAFVPLQFAPGEAHQFDWRRTPGGRRRLAHAHCCSPEALLQQGICRSGVPDAKP